MKEFIKSNWKQMMALPLSFLLAMGVWALDTRYVTISDLKTYAQEEQIEDLEQEVKDLTLKSELGLASEWEKALLEQRKIELYNKQQGRE